jgi:hypothetical protein
MGFLRDFVRRQAEQPDDPPPPIDPATLSEEEFDQAIDLLMEPQFVFAAEDLLHRAGPRAESSLLRAMRSGKLFTDAAVDGGMYRSALVIVGYALLTIDSRDWLEAVRPHVLSDNRRLADTCSLFLGHLAEAKDLGLVRQVLALPEVSRRLPGNSVISGLANRLRKRPQDASLVRDLIEDLWTFSNNSRAYDSARGLLLKFDRQKTLQKVREQFLVRPDEVDLNLLHQWSAILGDMHVRLEPAEAERLYQWAHELTEEKAGYLAKYLKRDMLRLGALARSETIRKVIDVQLTSPDSETRGNALRAHAFWHNIDFWSPQVDWEREDLPEPVKLDRHAGRADRQRRHHAVLLQLLRRPRPCGPGGAVGDRRRDRPGDPDGCDACLRTERTQSLPGRAQPPA